MLPSSSAADCAIVLYTLHAPLCQRRSARPRLRLLWVRCRCCCPLLLLLLLRPATVPDPAPARAPASSTPAAILQRPPSQMCRCVALSVCICLAYCLFPSHRFPNPSTRGRSPSPVPHTTFPFPQPSRHPSPIPPSSGCRRGGWLAGPCWLAGLLALLALLLADWLDGLAGLGDTCCARPRKPVPGQQRPANLRLAWLIGRSLALTASPVGARAFPFSPSAIVSSRGRRRRRRLRDGSKANRAS